MLVESLGDPYHPIAGNSHLLLTRVVSLGMNGSYLEKMSDKKDGKIPLELVDIWNGSLIYSIE